MAVRDGALVGGGTVEAGPEDLTVKRALFAALRAHFGPDTPILSTSSAITVSQILEAPEDRRACTSPIPRTRPR